VKKITFQVNTQKDLSLTSLIKEVNKISCKISIDLKSGYVSVENVNDTMIDSVIELVNNYYTILGVEINNTLEELTDNQDSSVLLESSTDTNSSIVREISESVSTKQPTDITSQIKEIEFENKYLEKYLNNLLRTISLALCNNATEKDISDHILTCISEISMRFFPKPIVEFATGDIVDINFGTHLPGEIIGGHIHGIVCNIFNGNMAYVVPIIKSKAIPPSILNLNMDTPTDASYYNEHYAGGTVFIDKGKYIRAERIKSVIGKTTPEFFEKLLKQLPLAFDFAGRLSEAVQDNNSEDLPTLGTPNRVFESTIEGSDIHNNASNSKTSTKKIGDAETNLLETFGFALDKLDSSKPVGDQVESFLTDIGMPSTERLVTQAFIIACNIKKINYENIISALHEKFPTIKQEIIKITLKETFKNWLKAYPTLAEKCSKISLMAVLKVFAKKFA